MEYTINEQVRAWGRANGYDVELHLDHFNDYLANKPGKPYKDLDAAYRSCVRADWGGLRKAQTRWQPQHAKPNEVIRANTFIPLPTSTVTAMPENLRKLVRIK